MLVIERIGEIESGGGKEGRGSGLGEGLGGGMRERMGLGEIDVEGE